MTAVTREDLPAELNGASIQADAEIKSAAIYAVVTRADGTVENRGLWSYRHSNPVMNYLGNLIVRYNVRRAKRKGWK